jgi:predicted nucleotidyltransferase
LVYQNFSWDKLDFAHPFRVVSPTLDGDVLAVLAGAEEAFSGRRIHRLVGHGSEAGVRKAVERLVDQGIVLRSQAGRANLYQLNREHVAAAGIEILAASRSELIARLREAIVRWEVPPRAVVLFGSVARGEAEPESDLDLLVVRPASVEEETTEWEDQLTSLGRQATDWTGNDARIMEFSEVDLGVPVPLLDEAISDGIDLFGSLRRLRDSAVAGGG